VLQLLTIVVRTLLAVAVLVAVLAATAIKVAVLAVVGNLELLRWVPQAQMADKALTVLEQDQAAVLVERLVVGLAVLADQAITQAERVARVVLTQVALWTLLAAAAVGELMAVLTG
tara:strand:+ start:658 stop:1005 length:348 start_codon:yes stop_codon:yes gene_type:complete